MLGRKLMSEKTGPGRSGGLLPKGSHRSGRARRGRFRLVTSEEESKAPGWFFAVLIGFWVLLMFVVQPRYMAHHLPLIRSGLAAAEREGPDLYNRAGVPPGATACSPITMTRTKDEDSESMWEGVEKGVVWTAVWDAPLDRAGIDAWYKDRLQADGWKAFQGGGPSPVENEYWKDKWLLSIEHEANFATERPPHARFQLRLEWDYWHKLDTAGQPVPFCL